MGVLFLLTPWTGLYDALQLVRPQPALVGQAFGFVLIGLGWLAAHAAFDGALTAAVGRAIGHVNWIVGVLMLVWLIGLHTPSLSGFGELVAGALGAWMIVLGLAGVRLARAVRRRDRALAQETAAAARAPERREPAGYGGHRAGTYAADNAPAPRVDPVGRPATDGAVARPAVVAQPVGGAAVPAAPAPSATDQARDGRHDAARDEAAGSPRPPWHG